MAVRQVLSIKAFGGFQKVFSHTSTETGCKMTFAVFLPAKAKTEKLPVLYYLAGMTSDQMTLIEKGGAQKFANDVGLILVCPDTSPRKVKLPGVQQAWGIGEGFGFYVDATEMPWKTNYRMYSYVTTELIGVVNQNFPVLEGKQSIFGHSMGGSGAFISALKNPTLYKSVSAFAPICNPAADSCTSVHKAYTNYLGPKSTHLTNWQQWDATELVKNYKGGAQEFLIYQGAADPYIKELLPENFIKSCETSNIKANLVTHPEYCHSYYYIATFVEEHIKYHAEHLKK